MKRFHTKHFAKDLRGMEKEREKERTTDKQTEANYKDVNECTTDEK